MKVQVNGPALVAAIKAVIGVEGLDLIDRVYLSLVAQERNLREEADAEVKAAYEDGVNDGYESFSTDNDDYEAGFRDGYEAAKQAFYSSEQPVIHLPDRSIPEEELVNAVAALEGHAQ